MEQLKKTWRTLAENVDQFFQKNSQGLNCMKGCSQCCEVDRTVFGIEAEIIADHIEGLSDQDFNSLIKLLKETQDKDPNHCAFLKEGACLVYEARPLICRSHGLVHLRPEGPHHCELNFEAGLPPKEKWLDEERLSLMLSMLQREYEKNPRFAERLSLSVIRDALLED